MVESMVVWRDCRGGTQRVALERDTCWGRIGYISHAWSARDIFEVDLELGDQRLIARRPRALSKATLLDGQSPSRRGDTSNAKL